MKQIIDDLKQAVETEKKRANVDQEKINALQEQINELEVSMIDFDTIEPIPFERKDELGYPVIPTDLLPDKSKTAEPVEETPSEESLPEDEDSGKMVLVNKLDGRPLSEITALADTFKMDELVLSETNNDTDDISLTQMMNRAIEEYKKAQLAADRFKDQHKDVTDQKSALTYAVTTLKRTLYGLAVQFAQRNVRIQDNEVEGLWDVTVEDAEALPEAVNFAIKYEIEPAPQAKKMSVITDPKFRQWCLDWHPELLVIDAAKAEDYIKGLRGLSLKGRKSKQLPKEMPPASIVPKIQPTVGKVSYADLTDETIYKIEYERQGEIEPLFKITSSARSKPLHKGLTYDEAKQLHAGYTQ